MSAAARPALPTTRTALSRWYWAPAGVVVLGLLSIVLLLLVVQINARQRVYFAWANALMDLRIQLKRSNLGFDRALRGERDVDLGHARRSFDDASRLATMLLTGGESEHGLMVGPLGDEDVRTQAQTLVQQLATLAAVLDDRPEAEDGLAQGPVVRAAFDDLQHVAGRLEDVIEAMLATDHAAAMRLLAALLVSWCSILVIAAFGLLHHERRRRHAEAMLRAIVEDLDARVIERTRQLREANDDLHLELAKVSTAEAAVKDSEAELRELSVRLLAVQEAERRRIAQELHDEFGHSLVLLKRHIRSLAPGRSEGGATATATVEMAAVFIDEVIANVRRLARDLRPEILEDLGLWNALRALVDNVQRAGLPCGISCHVDLAGLLTPAAELVVYRIVQEALTNAEKHAGATSIHVTVERQGNRLLVAIADDGVGFDVRHASRLGASERGMGLATMRERARMLDGSLQIVSDAGKGTCITLGIPIRTGGADRRSRE